MWCVVVVILLMGIMGYLRTRRLLDDIKQVGKESETNDKKSRS
jgi:hypothetical protein